ncbi:MAG: FprA family A-type flavoprotein, partial [bacterium]|nr:FprA family A-type flavoprotein [bacterium]
LAPKNRVGLAFGSYGWSGQSVGLIEDVLKSCGFEMMKNIRLKYIPDEETLQSITEEIKGELV